MARDTPRSFRELEREIEDLEHGTSTSDPDPEEYEAEQLAEARERWDADEYDYGSWQKVLDAHTLAFTADPDARPEPEWSASLNALATVMIDLDVGGYLAWKPISDLPYDEPPAAPTLPPVPNGDVADALGEYGQARGVDVPELRRQNPDDWVEDFMAELYYSLQRQRIERSAADWADRRQQVRARIARWREAIRMGEWPGEVIDGKWRRRPLEEYL